jgi:hypothetical protein
VPGALITGGSPEVQSDQSSKISSRFDSLLPIAVDFESFFESGYSEQAVRNVKCLGVTPKIYIRKTAFRYELCRSVKKPKGALRR